MAGRKTVSVRLGKAAHYVWLVLLAGCWKGSLPDWKSGLIAPEERSRLKTVREVHQFTTTREWEQSPWYRVGDPIVGPVYFVVADDRTACVVPASDWAIVQAGDRYPCHVAWRSFQAKPHL